MSFSAFTTAADEDGCALLREHVVGQLDRGGAVRIVVPTARDAETVMRGLERTLGEGLLVDVTGRPPAVNAYVVAGADGHLRAYQGATTLTNDALTAPAPGVLFDMREDAGAATALLADMSSAAQPASSAQYRP